MKYFYDPPYDVKILIHLLMFRKPQRFRLKKSNKMQLYEDIYILLNCSTCFERNGRPKYVEQFSSKLISAYCCILLDLFNL